MHKANGVISLKLTIEKSALSQHGYGHLQFLPSLDPANEPYLFLDAVQTMAADASQLLSSDVTAAFTNHCKDLATKAKKLANRIPEKYFPLFSSKTKELMVDYEICLLLWGIFFAKEDRRRELLKVCQPTSA